MVQALQRVLAELAKASDLCVLPKLLPQPQHSAGERHLVLISKTSKITFVKPNSNVSFQKQ